MGATVEMRPMAPMSAKTMASTMEATDTMTVMGTPART